MMKIDNKFKIGQPVYLITDNDQRERLVIGIIINPNGILYTLACGDEESDHYDLEIMENKQVI